MLTSAYFQVASNDVWLSTVVWQDESRRAEANKSAGFFAFIFPSRAAHEDIRGNTLAEWAAPA
jgi:hypothetical protein